MTRILRSILTVHRYQTSYSIKCMCRLNTRIEHRLVSVEIRVDTFASISFHPDDVESRSSKVFFRSSPGCESTKWPGYRTISFAALRYEHRCRSSPSHVLILFAGRHHANSTGHGLRTLGTCARHHRSASVVWVGVACTSRFLRSQDCTFRSSRR